MKLKKFLIALAATFVMAGPAQAAIYLFTSNMDGLQEVPPNASPGTGYAELSFDDTTNILTITFGEYSGLISAATAAHVHGIAPPGVNAGVIFGLVHTPATSGSLTGSGVLNAAQVIGLFDGNLYINVHTSTFPGGEVRGQIVLVPAPGALALLGLAGMVGSRRRRH